jgi:hypothetical protein
VLRPGGVFYVWDRSPGVIIPHGTKKEELNRVAVGFSKFELLRTGRNLRARFIK